VNVPAHLDSPRLVRHRPCVVVYAIVNDSTSPHAAGDAVDVFIRREDAERFIAEVRADEEFASYLRIEERELEAGGLN
jgi:hypothetical protein